DRGRRVVEPRAAHPQADHRVDGEDQDHERDARGRLALEHENEHRRRDERGGDQPPLPARRPEPDADPPAAEPRSGGLSVYLEPRARRAPRYPSVEERDEARGFAIAGHASSTLRRSASASRSRSGPSSSNAPSSRFRPLSVRHRKAPRWSSGFGSRSSRPARTAPATSRLTLLCVSCNGPHSEETLDSVPSSASLRTRSSSR